MALLLTAALLAIDIGSAPDSVMGRQIPLSWQWYALGTFVVFCFITYYRRYEQHRELETLRDENVPLAVRFDRDGEGMWWPEEAWYRFAVYNDSRTTMARNVEAELMSIAPNPFQFKALPSLLTLKDGGERADINPGRRMLVDFVRRMPRPPESRQLFFWIKGAPGLECSLEPEQDYEAKVIVSGGNHKSALDARFVLRHPLGKELEINLKSVTALTGVLENES